MHVHFGHHRTFYSVEGMSALPLPAHVRQERSQSGQMTPGAKRGHLLDFRESISERFPAAKPVVNQPPRKEKRTPAGSPLLPES